MLRGFLYRLSVRSKLLLGFVLVSSLIVVFGGYLAAAIDRVETSFETVGRKYRHLTGCSHLELSNRTLSDSIKAFILTKDPEWETLYDSASIDFDGTIAELKVMEDNPEELEKLAEFQAIVTRLKGTELLMLSKAKDGDTRRAVELFDTKYEQLQGDATQLLTDLAEHERRAIAEDFRQSLSLMAWIKNVLAVLLVGLVLAVVVVSFLLASAISRPLRRLVEATQRISGGDLASRVQVSSADEIGSLATAFNEMAERVQESYLGLEKQLAERTRQLSRANDQLKAEIADREEAEGRVRASLKEKELLLKEINHRVKNNLQVISSLLSLQSGYFDDDHSREFFRECQNRIVSIGLVHEKLYQSNDLANIDCAAYIHGLAASLFRAYSVSDAVKLSTDVDHISLGVDAAVPFGLIVNELVSNSLKYAFPDGKAGEVRVELRSAGDQMVTLRVSDNGIGLPPDLDFKATESLGLRLVNILTNQLKGTLRVPRGAGTEFEITFSATGQTSV